MGHLTKTERHRIEQLLRQQKNFQEIATALLRPRSTIMREVLKHRQESFKTPRGELPIDVFIVETVNWYVFALVADATENAVPAVIVILFAGISERKSVLNWKIHPMFAMAALKTSVVL